MKLSDAIRLGAMLRPQFFGAYFDPDDNGPEAGSCALGAAIDAAGFQRATWGRMPFAATAFAKRTWPWASDPDRQFKCPAGCSFLHDIVGERPTDEARCVIPHLNDCHQWTREQIADWVATVEPAEVVTETPVTTESVTP